MGSASADPVEPNPPKKLVERKPPAKVVVGCFSCGLTVDGEAVTGYSGSGRLFVEVEVDDPTLPQQWRTPPLWGVRDSAPYMHDGRAETLLEAIEMHGGQAAASAARFRELPQKERASVIAFLETLAAPVQGR
jgi:cytochrome c peroxidase